MSQDHTRLPPTRGEGQGLTAGGVPDAVSIWERRRQVEAKYAAYADEAQCACLTCWLGRSNSLGALSFARSQPLASAAGQSLTEASVYGSSPLNDEAQPHPPGSNSHEG